MLSEKIGVRVADYTLTVSVLIAQGKEGDI
jgi:hypothetical protein